ncbi:MAG: hypothetical protein ACKO96_07590, partial [Flammeovirgaceae bacterium]
MARIRSMGDEASSRITSAHDVGGGLTNLSRSDSVRRVLDTPEGFRHAVPTGSGNLAPEPERRPETCMHKHQLILYNHCPLPL